MKRRWANCSTDIVPTSGLAAVARVEVDLVVPKVAARAEALMAEQAAAAVAKNKCPVNRLAGDLMSGVLLQRVLLHNLARRL
jgi:hypothetical protein